MKLSVVIAAYNERENVGPLVKRLLPVLRGKGADEWEILFVVEGTDGTRDVLEGLQSKTPQIRVLYNEQPYGLGAAFRRGFAALAPDRDVVVTMDADLNHQPEEIPRLVRTLRKEKADVVVGSRFVSGSHVEGTPFWKRLLSGTMNVALKGLFGLSVRDKTSGFRVYRGDALRRLSFRNDDFAFLPELLVAANRAGMKIVEEPIRFVYRTAGRSKMAIAKTVRSYVRLLATRFDALSLLMITAVALGIFVRVLALFPVHKFTGDADALLTGLRTLEILSGSFPVFYSGVRIGALESYLQAPAVALLGPSRAAVSLTPVIVNTLTLIVYAMACRAVLPRRLACVAIVLMAFPSANVLFWTSLPNGYPSTVLLGLVTLVLGHRLATANRGSASAASLGIAAGLGYWNSIQTLACTAVAGIWVLWHRGRATFRVRLLLGALAGFLLGAAPWIIYNSLHPLASFRQGYGARPTHGLAAILTNGAYAIRGPLADLLISTEPSTRSPNRLHHLLQRPALAVYLAALVVLLLLFGKWLHGRIRSEKLPPPPWLFLVLPGLVSVLLFSVSEAGQFRGLTSRYLMFAWFAAPIGVALLAGTLLKFSRLLAAAAVAVVVIFNAAGYAHPWAPERKTMAMAAADDERLVAFLESRSIDAVLGDYWSVYPLNYLAGGRLRGVSAQPPADYYEYWRKLPESGVRWALLWTDPGVVRQWSERAGLAGTTETVGPYTVFLPLEETSLRDMTTFAFVERMQAAFNFPTPIVP